LALNLPAIVVINKIDRPDARTTKVIDEVLELFMELGADDTQIDFPVVYTSAKNGIAKISLNEKGEDLRPLFEAIINHIPAPERR